MIISSALCQKGLNSVLPYARRALTLWDSHWVSGFRDLVLSKDKGLGKDKVYTFQVQNNSGLVY